METVSETAAKKTHLDLKEFCDMEQLYRLLDNWSKSSGMSAVIVDTEGNRTSESFGMTEFCQMIHDSENGVKLCTSTWQSDKAGVYICPIGFCDFSIPIELPNGQILGKVLAGQALSDNQNIEEIIQKTTALGINKKIVKDVLSRVHRKTEKEMRGAYELLREMLRFFIEKSYSIWKTNNELQNAPAKKDRVLSQITQIMYSYNLTIDINTGEYTLITGTGMERTVDEYKKHSNISELHAFHDRILHPSYAARFNELISCESAVQNPSENGFRGTLEYPVIYPNDDEYEWHEINVFIDTEENGKRIINILGRDITEAHEQQEKKERELRASTARDQLLSGVTKMLYSYNMTVNVNTGRYTLIKGTGLEDTVARMEATDNYDDIYQTFIHAVDKEYLEKGIELLFLDRYRVKHDKTGHLGTEEFLVHYDKKPEWHEINVFAGYDENGEPIINILGRDVTEAHDKADTKAQLEIANASSAAKSAFLFNMSHDIRTPMNAIIGFTELLDKHLDDKELARGYIKKIKTSNDFLLSLINNVLEVARIESGKTTLDETVWNAYSFNDTLFALFDTQMREKGIEFVRTANVEHQNVFCDATKLREIFLNILSNALKYTPSGGKVTMRLTEIPSEREGYAMYQTEIEDTGIGMSEEFLPNMFDEFTREHSSTESRINGTGLGMAIVKKLVELMEGTIKVESKLGKGTKFTVTLPHRIAETGVDVQHVEKAAEYNANSFKGKRILLAEDNEMNAEIATAILGEVGFEVEHAVDGILCVDMLEKADANYYDLILMDIQMPNMDGYKATQIIRKFYDKQKAQIPILAMTANAFEEDRKNAVKAGMNGHISKPINVSDLMATLANVLKISQ